MKLIESDQIGDPSNSLPLESYYSEQGYIVGEHTIIHTPDGDVSVFASVFTGEQVARSIGIPINENQRADFANLYDLASRVGKRLDGEAGSFFAALGFRRFLVEEPGRPIVRVTISPTGGYINTSMRAIYGPEQLPPMVFVDKSTSNEEKPGRRTSPGEANGKEAIEGFAKGRVIMVSPLFTFMFEHDLTDHSGGYGALDAKTFGYITQSAKKLVEEGKTGLDEKGLLIDDEAIAFLSATHNLSGHLRKLDYKSGERYIRDCLKTISRTEDPEIIDDLFAGLGKHIEWLKTRSAETDFVNREPLSI